MHVTIVVCTYNRAASLAKTLRSLNEMSVPPGLNWEIVLVDNKSTDNTRDVVEEFSRGSGVRVCYVFEPVQGASQARNTGIGHASGEIIAFTDDDVTVAPLWLQEVANTFKEFDCLGVGGKSVPAWGTLRKPEWLVSAGRYRLPSGPILALDLGEEAKPMPVPPWGLNMAFKKLAFEKYGLFRTDLGPSGTSHLLGEDIEFANRLMRAGEKVIYSPKAVVFHPVSEKRITKQYYLSWAYDFGRTDIRAGGWPVKAVLYFGVPRYVFRSLVENCAKWFFAFDKKRRFFYKWKTYSDLGRVAEARKLRSEPPKPASRL